MKELIEKYREQYKDVFYNWSFESEKFHRLFEQYEKSDFDRQLAPSVDRVNSAVGYIIENMEWVTTKENSRRGLINRYKDDL